MSYQVLARKWRPKTFAELVGQEHVVTALTNALSSKRLHHAYLLTGTRGVGKTTIARLLAKSLNCITNGVTATPCGTCAACVDIDAGRFVDLLELDAASNTGVDNMREILDNARYAPTVGRYKVYLIDEVHMLSKSAFNSMLKTLEEPPEHVKFVLATTDPQKIPVTVLSRCLQFNLKQLPAAQIAERLDFILAQEKIPAEPEALALVARAAAGSMRDALSLLDQAIAHGNGEVREPAVRAMLGAVDKDYLYRIVAAVAAADGKALLGEIDAMSERSIDFEAALSELASLYHRIAVAQTVPAAASAFDDADRIAAFAADMTPEATQLAYQICVQGGADLALAPDAATGFSMALLRLLAFEPGTASGGQDAEGAAGPAKSTAPAARSAAPTMPVRTIEATKPRVPEPAKPVAPDAGKAAASPETGVAPVAHVPLPDDVARWPEFVRGLTLPPMAAQLAAQAELKSDCRARADAGAAGDAQASRRPRVFGQAQVRAGAGDGTQAAAGLRGGRRGGQLARGTGAAGEGGGKGEGGGRVPG